MICHAKTKINHHEVCLGHLKAPKIRTWPNSPIITCKTISIVTSQRLLKGTLYHHCRTCQYMPAIDLRRMESGSPNRTNCIPCKFKMETWNWSLNQNHCLNDFECLIFWVSLTVDLYKTTTRNGPTSWEEGNSSSAPWPLPRQHLIGRSQSPMPMVGPAGSNRDADGKWWQIGCTWRHATWCRFGLAFCLCDTLVVNLVILTGPSWTLATHQPGFVCAILSRLPFLANLLHSINNSLQCWPTDWTLPFPAVEDTNALHS